MVLRSIRPTYRAARLCVFTTAAVLGLAACSGEEEPAPKPTASHAAAPACKPTRPYGDTSPWNTPISGAETHPESGRWTSTLAGADKPLTADVDQYTIAVRCASPATRRVTVKLEGFYSDYTSGRRKGHGEAPTITGVPVPENVRAGTGTDKQIVLWDQERQLEYGFWQFEHRGGSFVATNGYVTKTGQGAPGVFTDGKAGRGAGFPYLAGLVTPAELKAGRIEHALAFAYALPSPSHVPPASKSYGRGHPRNDLPEGARLQLDPGLSEQRLRSMGLSAQGLTIARALQKYVMYVVDNSGSSKVYLEDNQTAEWPKAVDRHMLEGIPWSAFRVVRER